MQQAYADHPLDEREVFVLTAFLEKLNADQVAETDSTHGTWVLLGGAGGGALLFAAFGLIWMRRKKAMVYQDIYNRQTQTD